MAHPAALLTFPRLDYAAAWDLQHGLVEARAADRIPDTLILLEHDPVFTIGRTGKDTHWGGDEARLRDGGYPVYRVERGGSVTFHGPGQIVGYPILRLQNFCPGPKAYMRGLEEVVLRTLAAWDLPGQRLDRFPGVWVDEAKIAAMGVRITQGVTMHGFALNVGLDLAPYARIVPCGIEGGRVTSMKSLLGRAVNQDAVRERLAQEFAAVFAVEWIQEAAGAPVASSEAQR